MSDEPTPQLKEVAVPAASLDDLAAVLVPARRREFLEAAHRARRTLAGRTVWNVSSTAAGGGVAEMLHTLVGYVRGAGVTSRWLVIEGDARFFAFTKQLHNMLHGSPGAPDPLGTDEQAHSSRVLDANRRLLERLVAPSDIVLLHDPQTAGLAAPLAARGVHVVWRSHVGRDDPTPESEAAWSFLRPRVEGVEAAIFSRAAYAPAWLPAERVHVIPPSLDPLSIKNRPLAADDAQAALSRAGLLGGHRRGDAGFVRADGSPAHTRAHRHLLVDGGPAVPHGARVVLQVSRWDALKDMTGLLRAFAEGADALPRDAHLVLAGPDVSGVTDDPEGAGVLSACVSMRRALPASVRDRVHLACLPMDDLEENAHLVNALQRAAYVVIQKSLAEGFGLTVAEAMWKAKPVIGSRVGGIADQIEDGVSGLLLDDPRDLGALARLIGDLLHDPDRATRLGVSARERVRAEYLPDRHLLQYERLFEDLLEREAPHEAEDR